MSVFEALHVALNVAWGMALVYYVVVKSFQDYHREVQRSRDASVAEIDALLKKLHIDLARMEVRSTHV